MTGARTPLPLPRQEHETQPLRLTARVVARRIRDYLEGRWTRSQLSDWAACQFVKQDFSSWFDQRQSAVLRDAVASLVQADQAAASDDTAALCRLTAALEKEA